MIPGCVPQAMDDSIGRIEARSDAIEVARMASGVASMHRVCA